jgi:hypothetical protein
MCFALEYDTYTQFNAVFFSEIKLYWAKKSRNVIIKFNFLLCIYKVKNTGYITISVQRAKYLH